MAIWYKNKGRTIVHKQGQSRQEVICELEKRIDKRQKELDKRQWIVDEYNSLLSNQAQDKKWLNWCRKQTDDSWYS